MHIIYQVFCYEFSETDGIWKSVMCTINNAEELRRNHGGIYNGRNTEGC